MRVLNVFDVRQRRTFAMRIPSMARPLYLLDNDLPIVNKHPEFTEERLQKACELFQHGPEWRYITSAISIDKLPSHKTLGFEKGYSEIAFCGRSNVGKSTLINQIGCKDRAKIAITSKTPGRTQMLNFYALPNSQLAMIDLPGYGYAKAPQGVIMNWQQLMLQYIKHRHSQKILKGCFLLIEAKAGPKNTDIMMMEFFCANKVPFQCVVTRADKLSVWSYQKAIDEYREVIRQYPMARPFLHVTSGKMSYGIAEVLCSMGNMSGTIDRFFQKEDQERKSFEKRQLRKRAIVNANFSQMYDGLGPL